MPSYVDRAIRDPYIVVATKITPADKILLSQHAAEAGQTPSAWIREKVEAGLHNGKNGHETE